MNYGPGLYLDQASDTDLEGFPTEDLGLITFK